MEIAQLVAEQQELVKDKEFVLLNADLSVSHGVHFNIKSFSGFGAQGDVFLAEMLFNDGSKRMVQIKFFRRETYDDVGEYMILDPKKEANEMNEALLTLRNLGFKVLPYFGLATNGDLNFIVMEDLSKSGELLVLDSKHLARGYTINVPQPDGTVIEDFAYNIFNRLSNLDEVNLELLRFNFQEAAYDVSFAPFGAGVHMFAVDLESNTAASWVSDVGMFQDLTGISFNFVRTY